MEERKKGGERERGKKGGMEKEREKKIGEDKSRPYNSSRLNEEELTLSRGAKST